MVLQVNDIEEGLQCLKAHTSPPFPATVCTRVQIFILLQRTPVQVLPCETVIARL